MDIPNVAIQHPVTIPVDNVESVAVLDGGDDLAEVLPAIGVVHRQSGFF